MANQAVMAAAAYTGGGDARRRDPCDRCLRNGMWERAAERRSERMTDLDSQVWETALQSGRVIPLVRLTPAA